MPASAGAATRVPKCAWATDDRITRSGISRADPALRPNGRRHAREHFLAKDARVGSVRISPLVGITDPAEGSTSSLAWPPPAATGTAVLSPSPAPHTLLGPPILVVDDEPSILALMSEVLSMEGYAVCTATNGAEALQLLEPRVPQLVVLDMRMPVLDGWGFARAVERRRLKLPVLVVTAAADGQSWARDIGAAGYIAKPFDFRDLLAEVERLVARA